MLKIAKPAVVMSLPIAIGRDIPEGRIYLEGCFLSQHDKVCQVLTLRLEG